MKAILMKGRGLSNLSQIDVSGFCRKLTTLCSAINCPQSMSIQKKMDSRRGVIGLVQGVACDPASGYVDMRRKFFLSLRLGSKHDSRHNLLIFGEKVWIADFLY